MLDVIEIDADEQIAAHVMFDLDDIDAAFAELDARYLAGEAAAHAHTWSVIAGLRRAQPARARRDRPPDWREHRPPAGDSVRAGRHDRITSAPRGHSCQTSSYPHRGGASARAISERSSLSRRMGPRTEGFDAEWRDVSASDGRRRPDQTAASYSTRRTSTPRSRGSTNSVGRRRGWKTRQAKLTERYLAYFAARDWDAMAEILADDIFVDDRRRVVNAGVRHGRDAEIENVRAIAEVGVTNMTSTVIATRGERLVLVALVSVRDQRPEAFHTEVLGVVEIDADKRIAAVVMFDLDDLDAAFAELDARYLAGEAAAARAHVVGHRAEPTPRSTGTSSRRRRRTG